MINKRFLLGFYSMLLMIFGVTNLVAARRLITYPYEEPKTELKATSINPGGSSEPSAINLLEVAKLTFFVKNIISDRITLMQSSAWNDELGKIKKYVAEHASRFLDEYNKLENVSNELLNTLKINYAANISNQKITDALKQKVYRFIWYSKLPDLRYEIKKVEDNLFYRKDTALTRLKTLWTAFKKVVPKQKKEVEEKKKIVNKVCDILADLGAILKTVIENAFFDLGEFMLTPIEVEKQIVVPPTPPPLPGVTTVSPPPPPPAPEMPAVVRGSYTGTYRAISPDLAEEIKKGATLRPTERKKEDPKNSIEEALRKAEPFRKVLAQQEISSALTNSEQKKFKKEFEKKSVEALGKVLIELNTSITYAKRHEEKKKLKAKKEILMQVIDDKRKEDEW